MLIRRKKGWELSEAAATPQACYVDRRRLLAGMGIGGLILAAPAALQHIEAGPHAASGVARHPSAGVDEPRALPRAEERAVSGRSTDHGREIRDDL